MPAPQRFARRRADAHRVLALLQRRRVDGRFAPGVTRLVRELVSLELTVRVRRVRRVAGRGGPLGVPPSMPFAELPHDTADHVIPRLIDAGLEPFLIATDPTGPVVFGIAASARSQAHQALRELDPDHHWQLETERGGRRRTGRLHARSAAGRAARAERWRVFRPFALGELPVGADHGVELTFWTPAANGRIERIGQRGLHRYEADDASTVEHVAGRSYPGLDSFPVERSLGRFREPVDAVITWVDGNDPRWRETFDHWRRIEFGDRDDQATHPARFTSHDELRHVLRSLWINAGWIRNIFVVTADQRPDWLVDDDRLRLVSHSEILEPDHLPTFNSHAIEARLHHIDGLAEHFVYLNDDMLIGRPVRPEQFFAPNGLARVFESEARIPTASSSGPDLSVDMAARRGRDIIAHDFGVRVAHKLHHAPYALRRSVLAEIEERYGPEVATTAGHRFRHPTDLSIPSAFAHHYGVLTGRAVPGELVVAYENLGGRRLELALRRLELGRDVDAFCINETETWEVPHHDAVARLGRFLDAYFPVPSPWERPS